jgi:glycosyltransferase involved in cell wall biosynthesis
MSGTPKVLHVVISMVVGGAERLVYDMVRHPLFSTNKPIICCMDELGELGEKLRSQGYRVYVKGRRPGFDWEMIAWLRSIIKLEHIEVVHAHQYSPLFYTVPAAWLAGGVRVVYTEHGRFFPDRKSWKRSLLNPLWAKGVRHLVSISEATANAMATYDNLPHHRIRIVHNGIDCSATHPTVDQAAKKRELGLPESCRVIGTAARLNSIKNIQMMVRAHKIVLQQEPECWLVIAGEGEEKHHLENLAAEIGSAHRIKFIGLRFDLPEIYQLFEVFLLSSYSEGISVTLLESMAAAVPAVVTDVGGNKEVVVPDETGFLVSVDDDRLLANKVCMLLDDPLLTKRMGAAALKRVNEEFSLDKMMHAYLGLYRN